MGPLEWILVTPSNHRVHHARNEVYLDKNYGGVFIIWDRIFGTFKDERADEPCVFGITTGLKSWNPLWANFHFWLDTAKLAWRTKSWGDKFKVWFKPPAWVPADLAAHKHSDWRYPKYDPPARAFVKGYAFVQFWLLLGAALWLQNTDAALPRPLTLLLFVWICLAFYAQGVYLEARTNAGQLEWLRLGITALLGGGIAWGWPAWSSIAITLLLYSAGSAMVLLIDLGASRVHSSPEVS